MRAVVNGPGQRALSDANLGESHREFARWHPDGEVMERDGVLLTRGADRYPGVNFAMRAGHVRLPASQVVERAVSFFRGRADGFAVRARAHLDADLAEYCAKAGWMVAGENVGLMRATPLPAPALAVRIEAVQTPEGALAFASLATSAFSTIGLPHETAERIFEDPAPMLAPHLLALVAHHHDQPAAVAMVLFSHGIAGLYWVGTAPWARGRGLAKAVVSAAHNLALQRGARAVTLQANQQHAEFYRRLGYHEITRYPWYFASAIP